MVAEVDFTPYEMDALRELSNIGMGRAGAQLSEIFEHRVTLSVPNVAMMSGQQLSDYLNGFDCHSKEVNIIQQVFLGDIEGRSNLILGDNNYADIVEILGYEEKDAADIGRQIEMLSEIANAINSSCVSGLAEELNLKIDLIQPKVVAVKQAAEKLEELVIKKTDLGDYRTLSFEIKFFIEDIDLYCENIIAINSESMQAMHKALEGVL